MLKLKLFHDIISAKTQILTWQNLCNIVASQDKILETFITSKGLFPLTSNCGKLQWKKETFEL
jgi:hypothetical protein